MPVCNASCFMQKAARTRPTVVGHIVRGKNCQNDEMQRDPSRTQRTIFRPADLQAFRHSSCGKASSIHRLCDSPILGLSSTKQHARISFLPEDPHNPCTSGLYSVTHGHRQPFTSSAPPQSSRELKKRVSNWIVDNTLTSTLGRV